MVVTRASKGQTEKRLAVWSTVSCIHFSRLKLEIPHEISVRGVLTSSGHASSAASMDTTMRSYDWSAERFDDQSASARYGLTVADLLANPPSRYRQTSIQCVPSRSPYRGLPEAGRRLYRTRSVSSDSKA